LKQATKIAGYSKTLQMIPGMSKYKDILEKSKDSLIPDIERQIQLIEAMTPEQRSNPDKLVHLSFKEKQKIAEGCGQTVHDFNQMIQKFSMTRVVAMKVYQYQKEGKPIPNTQEEIKEILRKEGLSKFFKANH